MFHAKLLYLPRTPKRRGRPKAKAKNEGGATVRLKEIRCKQRLGGLLKAIRGKRRSKSTDVLSQERATIASTLSTQIARGPMLLLPLRKRHLEVRDSPIEASATAAYHYLTRKLQITWQPKVVEKHGDQSENCCEKHCHECTKTDSI